MKVSSLIVSFALVSACTVPRGRMSRPALPVPVDAAAEAVVSAVHLPPATDFTYELWNPRQTSLAQVFDDGHRTFLSFSTETPPGLMVFDENGKPVAFSANGNTVLIEGIRCGWLIRTPTRSSYAQTRAPERAARLEANGPDEGGVVALPADLAAARAEILSAQQRLDSLSAELDRASRGEPAAPLAALKSDIEEIQTRLDGVDATLVRAHFAPGSALLVLSAAAQRMLLDAARQARSVLIRGGADSTGSVAINSRIARARAENLTRLFIEGGVEPDKVTTGVATEDYVASNSTAAGRALNRRVDAFFVSAENKRIHGSAQHSPALDPQAGDIAEWRESPHASVPTEREPRNTR